MDKSKENEIPDESDIIEEAEEPEAEEPEAEEPAAQQEEAREDNLAQVDIVTSENKVTMSAPVKEFEGLKTSFKEFIAAFASFIDAAGLQIGKDENTARINALVADFDILKEDLKAEGEQMRQDSVLRSEFDEVKQEMKSEDDKIRQESVPRSEFDEFKSATDNKEAMAREQYVTRSEFERFRDAIREVI